MRKRLPYMQIVFILCVIWLNLSDLQAEDHFKININTAPAEELIQLKGVGPKKAAVIVEFRKANGPFRTPEDFIRVPGIGPKTYEANKERIVVRAD